MHITWMHLPISVKTSMKFSSDKKLVMFASRMASTDLVLFVLDLENASVNNKKYLHSAHIEFGILYSGSCVYCL